MGAGGCMTASEHESWGATMPGKEGDHPLRHRRAPTGKPPFTVEQLKSAIPPYCFDRSLIRSSYYLIKDLIIMAILFYLAIQVLPRLPLVVQVVAWPAYWFAQGCMLFSVWIVAHHCGHQTFSNFPIFNDVLGFILHSTLLVPYFSWKISHHRHHTNTRSLDNNKNFVPKLKESLPWYNTFTLLDCPLGRAFILFTILTLGWPLYLVYNVSSRVYPCFGNHFDPYSPIFSNCERTLIFISDVGLSFALYGVYKVAAVYGLVWVLMVYGMPLMITNAWLVTINCLLHSHRSLPYYDSVEWEWLRSVLSTIDRNYGFLNKIFHNLTDTHVLHHMFATIPHHHAMEATKAILPILGDYYQYDSTPIWKVMWREVKDFIYVKKENKNKGDNGEGRDVYWYSISIEDIYAF